MSWDRDEPNITSSKRPELVMVLRGMVHFSRKNITSRCRKFNVPERYIYQEKFTSRKRYEGVVMLCNVMLYITIHSIHYNTCCIAC